MRKLQHFLGVIALVFPFLALAQGYQVNLQGQVQQGMASAGTALIQDGAALFYNPGGMSFLEKNSVSIGATATIANGIFTDKNINSTYKTTSPTTFPFTGYAVYGVGKEKRIKLGLGAYTPFGSVIQWEDGWSGRFVLTKLQLQSIFIQPTISYKINEQFGFGAGFVYSTGKVDLQRDLPVTDANGNFGTAHLSGKASGFGFNAGLYFKATDKLSFGLSYRSQVNMKVKNGDATFSVPPSLASSFPNTTFNASLPLPSVTTFGVAFKPTEKLSLALDINYVGWNVYDTLGFDYANNTAALSDTKSARQYKNSMTFRFGGQYMLMDALALRLGIAYAVSPIQDGYVTPETPDASRMVYTAGIGYTFKDKFGFNASFLFEYLKRTDTNKESNLSGTYKTIVCAPGLSIFFNF